MTDKTNCYGIRVNDETMALIDKMNNQQPEDRIAALEAENAELKRVTFDPRVLVQMNALKGERDTLRQQLATARDALETVVERFIPHRGEYIFSKRVALDKAAKAIAALDEAQPASFGKSDNIRHLAENIMTDCGCSTQHEALRDKVEARLWGYFDALLEKFGTGDTAHVPETGFGDMAQTADSSGSHHADGAEAKP